MSECSICTKELTEKPVSSSLLFNAEVYDSDNNKLRQYYSTCANTKCFNYDKVLSYKWKR